MGTELLLPSFLLFSEYVRDNIGTITVLYLKTFLISEGLTDCLKSFVGRPRPYVYNEHIPVKDKMSRDAIRSFPSEHTMKTFFSSVFFSTVFSDYYPNLKWKIPVWYISISIVTLTGYLRYKARKHHSSNIIAGAAIGMAVGYGMPYFHRKTNGYANIVPFCASIGIAVISVFD